MEAILGVTGIDKIWPEENTDDENSSEGGERSLSTHGARFKPGELDKESADVSTKSAQRTLPR